MKFLLTLSLVLCTVTLVSAGEFNQVFMIVYPGPLWTGLRGVDGKEHSLADLKDRPVVVVVFTCNSCPVAVDYEDRIIGVARKHAGPEGKAVVVAINVNTIPEDRLDRMQERAR